MQLCQETWTELHNLLNKIRIVYLAGHLKKAYHMLLDFQDQLKDQFVDFSTLQQFEDNQQSHLLVQYYSLLGIVALKLSILSVSRDCVMFNLKILRFLKRDKQYYKYMFDNGMILQKIEYWLCSYEFAIQIIEILMEIIQVHLPSEYNDHCELLVQSANTYRAWCKYEKAEEKITQACEICMKNPSIDALVYSNVVFIQARFSMDVEKSSEGIGLAQQCLDIREKTLSQMNPQHIDISLAQELLAKLYFSTGQISKAEEFNNLAYENKVQVLGDQNFESIDSINEKGRILLSKKQDQQAKIYFKKLGDISLLLLGPTNQYEALSYNNLGCAFFNEKLYEDSITHHLKALRLYEVICGTEHYKLVFALNQMAYSNFYLRRFYIAISLWERCIQIMQKASGPPKTKNIAVMVEQIVKSKQSLED